jgi:hypothetical protein
MARVTYASRIPFRIQGSGNPQHCSGLPQLMAAQGNFSQTGGMGTVRDYLTLTRLADGRVLAAGDGIPELGGLPQKSGSEQPTVASRTLGRYSASR